jgi:hypothetical protein
MIAGVGFGPRFFHAASDTVLITPFPRSRPPWPRRQFLDDGCCRVHAVNFRYSEIKVKSNFGKSELLSFLKFRNMVACWISE